MTKWKALYLSCRPLNLLIMTATMYAVRYGLLYHSTGNGTSLFQSEFSFILLVSSIVLLAAGGNVINDFFDQQADKVNRPDSNFVGAQMSQQFTLNMYKALTLTGLLLGLIASWPIEPMFFLLHMFIAASLWMYSYRFMKSALIGNIIVGILVALLPFMVLHFEIASLEQTLLTRGYSDKSIMESGTRLWIVSPVVYAFSAFAFLVNVARELVKDIQDIKGDRAAGYNTLPIGRGIQQAKVLAAFLILMIIVLFSITFYSFCEPLEQRLLIWTIGLVAVNTPLIGALIYLLKEKTEAHMKSISRLLKVTMFFGILCLLVRWFF